MSKFGNRIFVAAFLAGSVSLGACTTSTSDSKDITAAHAVFSMQPHKAPWTVTVPTSIGETPPRILILHDMEGLSRQDKVETIFRQFEDYEKGQRLLAADVNAVIEGLFLGGAASVDVTDGHGSGNPFPDILTPLLDPRAKQIFRKEFYDPYTQLALENQYDAVVHVGGHGATGSGGFAPHTMTLGMDVRLNGVSITETEFLGLSWGRVNKPVIFSSGDDVLAQHLSKTMPWIVSVITKTALSADRAKLRPAKETYADLTAGASRAVENIDRMRAIRIASPVTATLRTVAPASLSSLKNVPGITYSQPGITPNDNAVSFRAADWDEFVSGIFGLIAVARGGYLQSIIDQYGREGDRGAFDRFYEKRMRVWLAQESGTLTKAPPRFLPHERPDLSHGIN